MLGIAVNSYRHLQESVGPSVLWGDFRKSLSVMGRRTSEPETVHPVDGASGLGRVTPPKVSRDGGIRLVGTGGDSPRTIMPVS